MGPPVAQVWEQRFPFQHAIKCQNWLEHSQENGTARELRHGFLEMSSVTGHLFQKAHPHCP